MKATISMYDDDYYCASSPKTLGDWVKNFRIKKLQMKRKLRAGGNLRVCAIMATALLSAEEQLRMKQQERLNRCLQLQSKFHDKVVGGIYNSMTSTQSLYDFNNATTESIEEEFKQRIEISNLWREELNGLDEFMRKMSSSGGSASFNTNDTENDTCAETAHKYGESANVATKSASLTVSS